MNKKQWFATCIISYILMGICIGFAHAWGQNCMMGDGAMLVYAAVEDAMYSMLVYIFFAGAQISFFCGFLEDSK